jgi:hypothetical protein
MHGSLEAEPLASRRLPPGPSFQSYKLKVQTLHSTSREFGFHCTMPNQGLASEGAGGDSHPRCYSGIGVILHLARLWE